MQTEQLLCWNGMTGTEHSTTSSSNEEDVPFTLETDASDVAISATLNQNHWPIAFYSRTLNNREV